MTVEQGGLIKIEMAKHDIPSENPVKREEIDIPYPIKVPGPKPLPLPTAPPAVPVRVPLKPAVPARR